MKKSENTQVMFRDMNIEELRQIGGGSFAYDAGRAIRFLYIYYSEGGGAVGHCCAVLDFAANMIKNS